MLPFFGPPGDSANFDKLRDDLIAAATAFSERVFDTGVDMLRERVRTAHRPLKDYLTGVTGQSTDWSARKPLSIIAENISFAILRTPGIAAVFGINTVPTSKWPYVEDSNGDKLLEEITHKINPAGDLTRQQASKQSAAACRPWSVDKPQPKCQRHAQGASDPGERVAAGLGEFIPPMHGTVTFALTLGGSNAY
jgi:hypothetical protein